MVFRHNDKAAKSTSLAGGDNLVRVKRLWREHCRVFVAIAPFAPGEGVEAPVDDADNIGAMGESREERGTGNGT